MTNFVNMIENNSESIENMTPEEFQRKLWTWLEEKGIFSEMKTHLRRQMIDVLKASEIGQIVSSNQKSKRSLSPKYKAINLLIAEYLLQQGYQYALSIFSMEDPTLSILPEQIPHNFAKPECDDRKDAVFKFLDEDVCDILETLGFSKDFREVQEIFEHYNAPKSKDTLIICLIRSMSTLANEMSKEKHFKGVNDVQKQPYQTKITQTTDEINLLYTDFKENTMSNQTAHELHQKMQIAFDQELEIIKKNERKKYINHLKSIETEMTFKLKKEREKLRQREIDYQNNLLKEFEVEFQRVQEKERLKEIEIERNLQKDLEIERKKLFDEYRSVAQSKTMNSSVLMELQQASLEAAIKAVQHQSSRLRKKENMLDHKLFSLNTQNVFKEKNDFSSQISGINESIDPENKRFGSQIKKFTNKVTQTLMVQTNAVACQIDNNLITSSEGVYSTDDKKIMEIEKSINIKITTSSVECQTELKSPNFQNKVCSLCRKNIQKSPTAQSLLNQSSMHMNSDQTSGENDKTNSSEMLPSESELPSKYGSFEIQTKFAEYNKKESSSNRIQIVTSLQNLLKNLQSENVSLKSHSQQQQNHIKELLKKHASMCKEVSEARIEAQELSNQLLQLEKVIDANCKSPFEQEGLTLKKSRSFLNNEDKYERKEKPKKTDYKFTDKGLEKIKETLKLLEREGEELDKSYKAFKLRQIDDSKLKISNITNKNENLEKTTLSASSSSLLLKHLKDIRISREKYQTREQSFDSHYSMDYVNSTHLNTERAQGHLMSFDRDILQNYIAISKDINMYNSKNPRAFANILKQRFITNKKGSLNDINNFAPLDTPRTRYSHKHLSSKLLGDHLSAKEEIYKRKYQFQAPQCLSSSKNRQQLTLNKTNALGNNMDDDLKISDEDLVPVICNEPLDSCTQTHTVLSDKIDKKNLSRPTHESIDTNSKIKTNVRKWAKLNLKNINSSSTKTDSNIELIKNKTFSVNSYKNKCNNDIEDIFKHDNKRSSPILNDLTQSGTDNNIQVIKIDNNKYSSQEGNHENHSNENLTVFIATSNGDCVKATDEIIHIKNDSIRKLDSEEFNKISDTFDTNNVETLSSIQLNPLINKKDFQDNVIEKINYLENVNDSQSSSSHEIVNDLNKNIKSETEQGSSHDNSKIILQGIKDITIGDDHNLLNDNHVENINRPSDDVSDKQDRLSRNEDPSGMLIDNTQEPISKLKSDFDDKKELDDKIDYLKEDQGNDQNNIEFGEHQSSIGSPTSNELILSTSIEISNNSHISVPKDSDEDDAFWK
ncbi:uncharacterized protein LOC143909122 [Arctopsyche grandis]|uniref:uncharacterized protein LOC143909122 n=1 Tax=Arctopsyche grandis TaxID=121162 RepID=UPI00406D63CD